MPLAWWSKRSLYQKCVFIVLSCIAICIITYSSINLLGKNMIEKPPTDIIVVSPNSTRARRKASFANSSNVNSASYVGKIVIVGPVVLGTIDRPFNGTAVIYDGSYKKADVQCVIGPWRRTRPEPLIQNVVDNILNTVFKDEDIDLYIASGGTATPKSDSLRANFEGDSNEESFFHDSNEKRPIALPLQMTDETEINSISTTPKMMEFKPYSPGTMLNGTAIKYENGRRTAPTTCTLGAMTPHIPSPEFIALVKKMGEIILLPAEVKNEDKNTDGGKLKLNFMYSHENIAVNQFIQPKQYDSKLGFGLVSERITTTLNSVEGLINPTPVSSNSEEGKTVTYPTQRTPDISTINDLGLLTGNVSLENATSVFIEKVTPPALSRNLNKAVLKIVESIARKPYSVVLPALEALESEVLDQNLPGGAASIAEKIGLDYGPDREIMPRKTLYSNLKSMDLTAKSESLGTTGTKSNNPETGSSTSPLPNTNVSDSLENVTTTDDYDSSGNTPDNDFSSTTDSNSDCSDACSWKKRLIKSKLTNVDLVENPIFSNIADDKVFPGAIGIDKNTVEEPNIVFPKFMATLEVLGNAPFNHLYNRKSHSNQVSNSPVAIKRKFSMDTALRSRRQSITDCKIAEGDDACKDISDAFENLENEAISALESSTEFWVDVSNVTGKNSPSSYNRKSDEGARVTAGHKSDKSGESTEVATADKSTHSGKSASVTTADELGKSSHPGVTIGGHNEAGKLIDQTGGKSTSTGSGAESGSSVKGLSSPLPTSHDPYSKVDLATPSAESGKESSASKKEDTNASDAKSENAESSETLGKSSTRSDHEGEKLPMKFMKYDEKNSTDDECECDSGDDSSCDDSSCGSDDFCKFDEGGCKKRIISDRLDDIIIPLEKEKPILSRDDARHKREISPVKQSRKLIGNLWEIFNNQFKLFNSIPKIDTDNKIKKFRHMRSSKIHKFLRRNFHSEGEEDDLLSNLLEMQLLINSLNGNDNSDEFLDNIPLENFHLNAIFNELMSESRNQKDSFMLNSPKKILAKNIKKSSNNLDVMSEKNTSNNYQNFSKFHEYDDISCHNKLEIGERANPLEQTFSIISVPSTTVNFDATVFSSTHKSASYDISSPSLPRFVDSSMTTSFFSEVCVDRGCRMAAFEMMKNLDTCNNSCEDFHQFPAACL